MLSLVMLVSLAFGAVNPNQKIGAKLSYYGTGIPSSGDIKLTLFRILNSPHTFSVGRPDTIGCERGGECYEHKAVGYSEARKILFGDLFHEADTRGNYVTEVYCRKKVYFRSVGDISNMSNTVNIEHTWPQSKFSRSFNTELQKSDLHHLFPSDSKANSARANFNFGEAAGYVNDDLCEPSHLDRDQNEFIFTPPTVHKGNVARALFYFSVRYRLEIPASEEETLRQWHKNDPVDAEERERHDKIAEYQLNRNPFIDFPELVNKVSDF